MKPDAPKRPLAIALLFFAGLGILSCGGASKSKPGSAASPRQAYEMLFAAVKKRDTEGIRKMLSKNSIMLAKSAAARNKKPIEEVLKNGFTATTFAETLPEMRDLRVRGNYAAIEVYNHKSSSWEDLPFVMEDGGWKLAVGDLFAGTFKSPGKSRSTIERENANAMRGNSLIPYADGNVNSNLSNIRPIKPARRPQKGGAAKK